MIRNLFIITILFGATAQADTSGVYLKMAHLRAQINAMDAQRELMQINLPYMEALGTNLSATAEDVLNNIGPGIPEHQMGLSGVSRLGTQIADLASKNNVDLLVKANSVRNQCVACHGDTNPPGGVDWDSIFRSDWNHITDRCNGNNKNPYLCKSMNGMLSAYGSLLTASNAEIQNFEMTRYAADEIVRILVDLKTKNFHHLSSALRDEAEADARELSHLAAQRNPVAFEKILTVTNACTKCHERNLSEGDSFSMKFSLGAKPVIAWVQN